MKRGWLSGLLLVLVAAGGLAVWTAVTGQVPRVLGLGRSPDPASGRLETLSHYGEVPDFRLIERSGRAVTRADLLGTVWVASFVYTHCTETCPLQTAEMARLQAEFAGEADFRLVSITVDPKRDDAEALSRYAQLYGADGQRWLFLTGDQRAIYRLAKDGFRLGVVDPDDPGASRTSLFDYFSPAAAWATHSSQGLIMHSSRLVVVDRSGTIRAYHLPDDAASLARLRRNVRSVLRERPAQ